MANVSGGGHAAVARAERQRHRARVEKSKRARRAGLLRQRAKALAALDAEKLECDETNASPVHSNPEQQDGDEQNRPAAQHYQAVERKDKEGLGRVEDKNSNSPNGDEKSLEDRERERKEASKRRRKVMRKRTSRGQPVMKHRIDALLGKLEKETR